MPIVNQSLGHTFTVGSVQKTVDTDTFINVAKRRADIVYRSGVPSDAANIAFVTTQELGSDTNLSIADRSTSLAANRVADIGYTTISGTKTFTINTEAFIVTDIFASETNTINPVPLFYKHTISFDNLPRVDASGGDLTLATGVAIVSVEIVDINFNPVLTSEIKYDTTEGIIYNNLLSEYNATDDFIVYFVKYVVNDNGAVKTYIDLLDNETVFRPATFDDLTPTLQIITDGRKVYLIDELTGEFNVTLPIVGTYAFQPLSTSRIEIIAPVPSDVTESWFVRVRNGTFFTSLSGTLFKYYISEFLTQSFTPEPPIKKSIQEKSTRLTRSLIKLDNENINESDDLGLRIEVLINDSDDNAVVAYTTDTDLEGVIAANGAAYEVWNDVDQRGIKSVDHRSGIIEIDGVNVKSDYEIISTYYYNEGFYEFTLINFNPISNREALTTRTSLFIDPDTVITTKSQTLFYLKIDTSGKVIESNWSEFNNESLLHSSNKTLYYEKLPSFLTTGIASVGEPNYVDPNDIIFFVDSFTVEGTQNGSFLVLGDVTVSEAFSASQAGQFDARTRGGGVIENEFESVLESTPEARWFWDEGYWDGIPYPGNASYMIEVPITSMRGAGGVFSPKQVRDILNRHTAAGIYPVAKAYGVDITVTGVEPGADYITLFWNSEGF